MAERPSFSKRFAARAALVASPVIPLAVAAGEQASHGQTPNRPAAVVRLVDYQQPTNKGTLVFSSAKANKSTEVQPTLSAADHGNPLSNAPWYDKVAILAFVEGAGAVALAGQKRTHEASNRPTRWTAYAGTGLGLVAANALAIAAVTGHI